jgi:hypothetical protein
MWLDTKTYWLTDRQSQCDFDFDFDFDYVGESFQTNIEFPCVLMADGNCVNSQHTGLGDKANQLRV